MLWRGVAWLGVVVWCGVVMARHSTVRYGVVLSYIMMLCCVMLCHVLLRYGTVWYGMVWYGISAWEHYLGCSFNYKLVIILYQDLIIKCAFPLSNDQSAKSIVTASDQDMKKAR